MISENGSRNPQGAGGVPTSGLPPLSGPEYLMRWAADSGFPVRKRGGEAAPP
jgi:hypothetical protein